MRRAASNLAAVKMDLAGATLEGDADRVAALEELVVCGADILAYRPQLQHYVLLFGDLDVSEKVVVVIPGVADGTDLREDWIPQALDLYEQSTETAVALWKGYDNPVDAPDLSAGSVDCEPDLAHAARELVAFVESLELESWQSLGVVTQGMGAVVTSAALADFDLRVDDVAVAGYPDMTSDHLRQLHLRQAHVDLLAPAIPLGSAVQHAPPAPGAESSPEPPSDVADESAGESVDASAEEGGEDAAGHQDEVEDRVLESSAELGPEAGAGEPDVENPRQTDDDADAQADHLGIPETVGHLVAWALRLPAAPMCAAGRRYRGPGSDVLVNVCHLIDFGAEETGTLVDFVLEGSGRALSWFAARVRATSHDATR